MTIDFDDGYIDPDSEYAKNLRYNQSMSDDSGIFIGNCYYTNEMLESHKANKEKEEKQNKK